MLLRPSDHFLFIGDSITDCGRSRVGAEWDSLQDLGDGYVSLIQSALVAVYPDYDIRIRNKGISGNTISDLKGRWHKDVLRFQPSWLSIFIGINDVWQHFDPSFEVEELVSLDRFHGSLDDIIRQTESPALSLVLMSPYYLEPDRQAPMRALMDRFGDVVRQAAARHHAIFVDVQAAFDTVLASVSPERLAADRIHVNQAGHMIIARAVLSALQFDWRRQDL